MLSFHLAELYGVEPRALVQAVKHHELAGRLDELERKCDAQFKSVFDAIGELLRPPDEPPRRIGFKPAPGDKD